MAVDCPMYSPVYGWFIIVSGPDGLKYQIISSPLYYYHSMGVKPPVGYKLTLDDYLDVIGMTTANDMDDMDSFVPTPSNSSLLVPPSMPSLPASASFYPAANSKAIGNPLSASSSSVSYCPQMSLSNDSKYNHNSLSSPSTSSGIFHTLPPKMSVDITSYPHATNFPKVNNNPISAAMFNDPDLAYEMYLDEVGGLMTEMDDSILELEDLMTETNDYEMS